MKVKHNYAFQKTVTILFAMCSLLILLLMSILLDNGGSPKAASGVAEFALYGLFVHFPLTLGGAFLLNKWFDLP